MTTTCSQPPQVRPLQLSSLGSGLRYLSTVVYLEPPKKAAGQALTSAGGTIPLGSDENCRSHMAASVWMRYRVCVYDGSRYLGCFLKSS